MDVENTRILSKDGLQMFVRCWQPPETCGVLCIIHGLGEHSGRYSELAEFLSSKGIASFAMDLRGHGNSPGKRGHSPSYDTLMGDLEELLKLARSEFTDLPIFFFGHSMGGNLVANYMISMNTNEVAGYILSAPWFKLAFDPPKFRLKLGRLVNRLMPSLAQGNDLNVQLLSKTEEEVVAYQKDTLVHDRITPGLFFQIIDAGMRALSASKTIGKPGLIYHGSDDQVISHDDSERFANFHANTKWKSIVDGFHEPHHDTEKSDVFQLIHDFLGPLCKGPILKP